MKYVNSIKKYMAVPISTGLMVVPTMVSFASESGGADGAGSFTTADWGPLMTSLTSQITVTTVMSVIAAVVAAGIGLVFMWWAARKLGRGLMSAFRKGRVSI